VIFFIQLCEMGIIGLKCMHCIMLVGKFGKQLVGGYVTWAGPLVTVLNTAYKLSVCPALIRINKPSDVLRANLRLRPVPRYKTIVHLRLY
jgi:hypothetical protein